MLHLRRTQLVALAAPAHRRFATRLLPWMRRSFPYARELTDEHFIDRLAALAAEARGHGLSSDYDITHYVTRAFPGTLDVAE